MRFAVVVRQPLLVISEQEGVWVLAGLFVTRLEKGHPCKTLCLPPVRDPVLNRFRTPLPLSVPQAVVQIQPLLPFYITFSEIPFLRDRVGNQLLRCRISSRHFQSYSRDSAGYTYSLCRLQVLFIEIVTTNVTCCKLQEGCVSNLSFNLLCCAISRSCSVVKFTVMCSRKLFKPHASDFNVVDSTSVTSRYSQH